MTFAAKPIAFKDAKSLADLFDKVEVSETIRSSRPDDSFFMMAHQLKERAGFYYVTPNRELFEYLKEHMIMGPEEWYFELVQRDDGAVLLTCGYNTILGNRWIALFDKSPLEVPGE